MLNDSFFCLNTSLYGKHALFDIVIDIVINIIRRKAIEQCYCLAEAS